MPLIHNYRYAFSQISHTFSLQWLILIKLRQLLAFDSLRIDAMPLEFAGRENALISKEEDKISSILLTAVYSDFEIKNVNQQQSKVDKTSLASKEDITTAIQKLGSPKYADREKASADLERMGDSAFPALVQALKNADPEIKARAQGLLQKRLKDSNCPVDPAFLKGLKLDTYGDCLDVMRCADNLNDGESKQLRDMIMADPKASQIFSESIEKWNKVPKLKERLEQLEGLHENGIEQTMHSLTDDQLKYITALKNLRLINLSSAINLTDEGIAHLKSLSKLETVILKDVIINDKSLEHLSKMPNLRSLDLTKSKFTDHGLECLDILPNLKALVLDGTSITDENINQLLKLSKLEGVSLRDTKVTDRGLMLLTSLPHLKIIAIPEGKVTKDGIKQFKTMMPNTRIDVVPDRDWFDERKVIIDG